MEIVELSDLSVPLISREESSTLDSSAFSKTLRFYKDSFNSLSQTIVEEDKLTFDNKDECLDGSFSSEYFSFSQNLLKSSSSTDSFSDEDDNEIQFSLTAGSNFIVINSIN